MHQYRHFPSIRSLRLQAKKPPAAAVAAAQRAAAKAKADAEADAEEAAEVAAAGAAALAAAGFVASKPAGAGAGPPPPAGQGAPAAATGGGSPLSVPAGAGGSPLSVPAGARRPRSKQGEAAAEPPGGGGGAGAAAGEGAAPPGGGLRPSGSSRQLLAIKGEDADSSDPPSAGEPTGGRVLGQKGAFPGKKFWNCDEITHHMKDTYSITLHNKYVKWSGSLSETTHHG